MICHSMYIVNTLGVLKAETILMVTVDHSRHHGHTENSAHRMISSPILCNLLMTVGALVRHLIKPEWLFQVGPTSNPYMS